MCIRDRFRKDHIFSVGSPLFEVLDRFEHKIQKSGILSTLDVKPQKYIVASIHREENLDLNDNFINILETIEEVGKKYDLPVYFSTHPRTRKKLEVLSIKTLKTIHFIKPMGFTDYVALQKNAILTLSDSGTIFEESAVMRFPAISLRSSTERPEASESGTILIGNINKENILQSIEIMLNTHKSSQMELPLEYKIKNVSTRVVRLIQSYTSIVNKEIWKK